MRTQIQTKEIELALPGRNHPRQILCCVAAQEIKLEALTGILEAIS